MSAPGPWKVASKSTNQGRGTVWMLLNGESFVCYVDEEHVARAMAVTLNAGDAGYRAEVKRLGSAEPF